MDQYRSHHRTAAKAGLAHCLRSVSDEPVVPDRSLIEDIVDEIVDAALDEAAMRTKAAAEGVSEAEQDRRDAYHAGWFDACAFLRGNPDALDVLDSRSMAERCWQYADVYFAALASVPPGLAPACAQCGNALAANGACYRCQPITDSAPEAPAHAD